MLVGGIGILDLRLAGLFRRIPTAAAGRRADADRHCRLAADDPERCDDVRRRRLGTGQFADLPLKLLLIALALANAVAFRFIWQRRIEQWDAEPPPLGRLMAAASILLWLSVAALGRWIAYS